MGASLDGMPVWIRLSDGTRSGSQLNVIQIPDTGN